MVSQGYIQTYDIDYVETSALVEKMNTLRILVIVVQFNWPLHQHDVENANLHGDFEEEIYMKIPPIYSSSRINQVCRLIKVLYGLK